MKTSEIRVEKKYNIKLTLMECMSGKSTEAEFAIDNNDKIHGVFDGFYHLNENDIEQLKKLLDFAYSKTLIRLEENL